ATPEHYGSIHAARIFDRGACSLEQPLATLQSRVEDSFWSGFRDKFVAEPFCPDRVAARYWSRTVSYLDHVPQQVHDLRGGFFFALHYFVNVNQVFWPDLHIVANANYRFFLTTPGTTLDNGPDLPPTQVGPGVLAVKPGLNFLQVTGPAPVVDDVAQSFSDGLTATVPKTLLRTALDEQTRDVLGAANLTACTPGAGFACGSAATKLATAVSDGGTALGLTGNEVTQLIAAEAKNAGNDNWRCVPYDGGATAEAHRCEYVVRAKRVNVYPDAVELVWFDGKELDNPTYALWVAAHAPGQPPSALSELCAWQPVPVHYPRVFAKSGKGYRNAGEDGPCFEPTGGGGCSLVATSTGTNAAGAALVLGGALLLLLRARSDRRYRSVTCPVTRSTRLGRAVACTAFLSGCGSAVSGGPGGAGGSGGGDAPGGWGGAAGGGAGGGVWTDCSSPSGFAICGGAPQCSCGADCLSPDQPISVCYNDALANMGISLWQCKDGEIRVDVSGGGGLDWCAAFELGVLYSNAGFPERARYSDHGLWTGDPLPLPDSCPAVPGITLCGGHCGGCPVGYACTGRSRLHPYSACFSTGPGAACALPDHPCAGGQGCFIYLVEPEAQADADRDGYCLDAATCETLAASFPGGGKCVLP
ncbi:MAG: hypothetical protein IT373_27380, partial [Polyangiaceae bacterium]|nr:hypothetical protein [Polyangiaceae bacterium]